MGYNVCFVLGKLVDIHTIFFSRHFRDFIKLMWQISKSEIQYEKRESRREKRDLDFSRSLPT